MQHSEIEGFASFDLDSVHGIEATLAFADLLVVVMIISFMSHW